MQGPTPRKSIFRLIKNKYLTAGLVFLVWIIFFDKNDLITQLHYRSELKGLQEKKAYYEQEIAKTELDRQALISSPEALEKFAREKYLMKKPDEDLFIIRDTMGLEK
ncbi:MAG: FtsB family cell division protein [Chitinophagaceae bacterium]